MIDLLERQHTPTVPVQGADSHKQVEEVSCAPGPRCPVEPELPCQLVACQAVCTAIHDGLDAEASSCISVLQALPWGTGNTAHDPMLCPRCAPGALSSRLKRRSFTASWRARACSRNYDERNHLQPCSTDDCTMLDVRIHNAAAASAHRASSARRLPACMIC